MLEEVDRLSQLVDRLLDALACRNAARILLARRGGSGRAGRGRRVAPGSPGRRERADAVDREDGVAAGACRSSVAEAGADQSRRQRDQVHAGSGTGPASSVGDPVAGRRRRDRHRAGCAGTRRATTSSTASIAATGTKPSGRDSGCRWPGAESKRSGDG